MSTEVKLPDLGEGIDSAEVVNVLVEAGQSVKNEQDILEIETDKATVTVPSSAAGQVEEILVEPGQTVQPGQVVLKLKGDGSQQDEPATAERETDEPAGEEPQQARPEPAQEPAPQPQERAADGRKPSPETTGGASDVPLPELGEGVEGGQVVSVRVSVGDAVQAEQALLEVETDKATVEVPSPRAGVVEAVGVSEGQSIQVGDPIVSMRSVGEGQQAAPPPEQADSASGDEEPQPTAEPKPQPRPDSESKSKSEDRPDSSRGGSTSGPGLAESRRPGADIPAGPAVRKLARQLGVDLRQVEGSGRGGRIQQDDLFRAVRKHNLSDSGREETVALPPPADARPKSGQQDSGTADAWGPVRREKLSKIRATIAETLARSASTIPHVTHFDAADITELEDFRQQRKNDLADEDIKLTMLPFIIKAVCECLRRHPRVNATLDLDAGEVIYKEYLSIGIAVDSDRGLVVPVLRNAGDLAIAQLARGLKDLAGKVRDNDYTVDDLRGGTFTISNQGAVGGQYATPIINPPQSAILLVGRGKQQPTVTDDGQIVPRLILPLSFSYDHRLIDGADAGRFVNDLVDLLEHPGKLLLRL
jgi:pyruvate dehydrogenase E2 component (dihydrolipoamide acetyltransferase)